VGVRLGVDVGGTFTKAVAFDGDLGAVVATAIVPTSHDHADGVSAGVVEVVARLAEQVGPERVELVTHSTTQAVNALLEGDVAVVGVIGMACGADIRKSRKRTVDTRIELSPGRRLTTVTEFLDVGGGLDLDTAKAAVERLRAAGAQAIAVAQAFAPDDPTHEETVAEAATAAGLPVTTSAGLTGLYGLEMRAVTAALNASILPIALRTAQVVGSGVAAAGIVGPVMVMRGDGGATDLAGFQSAPARTLYSGPAASVAGALRSGRIGDAVIVEVGGTSTNVAAVRRGRPALSYVQVASHATAIRALDVRVLGVAGGSMLRARRGRVFGVGPRSAHIAGLPYACYLTPEYLDGAVAELVAPRPGDTADHVVLRLSDGRGAALTNTCAANALGLVQPGDYAEGDRWSALAGFAAAGRLLGATADQVATRMLAASTDALCELVAAVIEGHHLESPVIVAVGGGAGGVGRAVAARMGLEITVPPNAEVISAIGDALSLIRAERERTFVDSDPACVAALVAEVEEEAVRSGAGPATLDIRVEHVAERGAVRVTATGSVGLAAGAVPGRPPADHAEAARAAAERGFGDIRPVGQFWVARGGPKGDRIAAFDRFADLVLDVRGHLVAGQDVTGIGAVLWAQTRNFGPITVVPDVWVISGPRLLQVPTPTPATLVDAVRSMAPAGTPFTVIIGRE
jgi:N-methylhydantoinase A